MKKKKMVRIIALVLVALLVGGVVFGAIVSALAETPASPAQARGTCALTMDYLEDEQALRVTQRLTYINRTRRTLSEVVFYAAGNVFRRESTLIDAAEDLDAVYPYGYAPAGIDLSAVRFDGADADYGFQGENEAFLRVACSVAPGAAGVFEFEYYLLLMRCNAFQGVGDTDVRLSAFYMVPGVYDEQNGDFVLNKPIAHARWLYCEAMDFDVSLTLPEGYEAAGTGGAIREATEGGRATWRFSASGARDFALSFGRRYRVFAGRTESGVSVRVLCNVRGAGQRALDALTRAVERCEAWFGPLPVRAIEAAQTDYPVRPMTFTGAIWIPSKLLERGASEDLNRALRFGVALQYFGLNAYVQPSADAWLSDSVSAYVAFMLQEAEEGRDRFLSAVNREWVGALQQTVPGGLRVTSDASLFSASDYDLVVLRRGAVVLHELRLAMGLDGLIAGLRAFNGMGGAGRTLTEMDFVSALDEATGGDWEAFLTDWVFNVGDYVNQSIDWFE